MHRLAGWDWDGAGGAGAVTTEGLESSFGRQTHLEDPGSVTYKWCYFGPVPWLLSPHLLVC